MPRGKRRTNVEVQPRVSSPHDQLRSAIRGLIGEGMIRKEVDRIYDVVIRELPTIAPEGPPSEQQPSPADDAKATRLANLAKARAARAAKRARGE